MVDSIFMVILLSKMMNPNIPVNPLKVFPFYLWLLQAPLQVVKFCGFCLCILKQYISTFQALLE